jgi:hypothetical protein
MSKKKWVVARRNADATKSSTVNLVIDGMANIGDENP